MGWDRDRDRGFATDGRASRLCVASGTVKDSRRDPVHESARARAVAAVGVEALRVARRAARARARRSRSRDTPARISALRASAPRSRQRWPGRGSAVVAASSSASKWRSASRTGRVDLVAARPDVRPDHGAQRLRSAPRAAARRCRASITPAARPRQPAWIAATALPSALAASTGTQSAVTTPIGASRARATTASASTRGRALAARCTTRAPCTWRGRSRPGGRRIAARAEAVADAARAQQRVLDHRAPISRRSSAAIRAAMSAGSSASKRMRSPLSRMDEAEHARVQRGPVEARLGAVAAAAPVDGIARDRQPDRREVHADLMRAPGLRAHLEQAARAAREAARDAPARARLAPAAAHHRHALAVARMARDRASTRPAVARRDPAHERLVDALDAVRVELLGERAVRVVVLRHHDHARRAAVEPVHDPRPQHAADRREVAAVVQQRVHERSARVARRGMHDHVGRLVDHHDRRVLVEDAQRDRLGLRARGHRVGRLGVDPVALGRRAGSLPRARSFQRTRSSSIQRRTCERDWPTRPASAVSRRCPSSLSPTR